MKKYIKFLLPFIVLNTGVLTSCKIKTDNRVLLTFGDVHAKESKEVDIDYFKNAVSSKENFLLVVNSKTCTCWNTFQGVLNPYLEKNMGLCYQISYNDFKDYAVSYGLTKLSSGSTTFAIFENGEVKNTLCTDSDTDIMYNADKFKKYMNENVILPKCFFIEKEDFDEIKTTGKNAVIYFERNACGDCQAINPGILRSYIKNNPLMNNIYVIDCQKYYGTTDYQTIKDDLGMSTKYNSTFGYGNGVFPFFSLIENGKYTSGAVVYNDTITAENDKYTITDSYYTEDRVNSLPYDASIIMNKELAESEVNRLEFGTMVFHSWKQEFADKVYGTILTNFLNHALPKGNLKY